MRTAGRAHTRSLSRFFRELRSGTLGEGRESQNQNYRTQIQGETGSRGSRMKRTATAWPGTV